MNKDSNKELEILFPEREFKYSLGSIQVSPFKFGHFAQVLRIVNQYIDAFSGDNVVLNILGDGDEALDNLALLTFFSTGLNRETLDSLPGDEALDLFFKVFEVNSDFFIRKMRLGAEKIAKKLSHKVSKAGE